MPHPDTFGMIVTSTPRGLRRPSQGRPSTQWWFGRPLYQGKNASRTNTREELSEALKGDCNWLEGDVRKEIHGNGVEMRHDAGQEAGESLLLEEWLVAVKPTGRGVKIDVMEPQILEETVRQVKAAGIPSERLMWSLGDAAMATWAAKLRQQFPKCILAIHPSGDGERLKSGEVARMIELAKRGRGGPIAFVVRYDRLTDTAIRALQAYGALSVWNDVGVAGVTRENIRPISDGLRARGVDGVIDLRPGVAARVEVPAQPLSDVDDVFAAKN